VAMILLLVLIAAAPFVILGWLIGVASQFS
jgi:hypothetical protein